MLKRWLYTIVLIMLVGLAQGQDLAFSQFYESPLLRNPALAGVFTGDVRVTGTFRNQWQSITVPFRTEALSAEVKFPIGKYDDWITAGLQLTQDAAGDIQLKRTQLLPVINFHKSLSGNSDNYLSIAFMGGPVHSQFDPTLLKLDDQFINGAFSPNNPTSATFTKTGFTYWDISTGISYTSSFGDGNKYYIGAGLFHANKPKVGFYTNDQSSELHRKFVINGGLTVPTGDINRVLLYADYLTQSGNQQFLGGLMYSFDLFQGQGYETYQDVSLNIGAFYRWNDAFIPTVKLDMYQFSVGLSYDANTSQLKTASQMQGGFEVTMSYKAKFRNRSQAGDKMKCISF